MVKKNLSKVIALPKQVSVGNLCIVTFLQVGLSYKTFPLTSGINLYHSSKIFWSLQREGCASKPFGWAKLVHHHFAKIWDLKKVMNYSFYVYNYSNYFIVPLIEIWHQKKNSLNISIGKNKSHQIIEYNLEAREKPQ